MKLLDVVVLTRPLPDTRLTEGEIGTIVELLENDTVLVEFTDRLGVAYAITPIPTALLQLREPRGRS